MSIVALPVRERSEKHMETFLLDLEQSGKSRHTLINYRSDLIHFLNWLSVSLNAITVDHLRDYFKTLSKLSPASVARRQASIKSFLGWCVRHDKIMSNPMDKVDRIKPPEKLPRPLDKRVVEKILKAIPSQALRDRLLFTLITDTGLRISEALNIYLEDISLNPDDEKITIRSGKGGKSRTVMLYAAPDTLKLLKKHINQTNIRSGALFRGSESKGGSKKPMHYRSAHYLWTKYCNKAGVDASIHALRHTFATELINEGIDVTVVRKLLGHKNLQTTMRYSEVSDQHIKEELMKKHRRNH
jgi:integrase/recombinase XerD